MKSINRTFQTTFVFSTHDKKVIAKADRLVRMEDGRVRRLGMRTHDGWVLVKDRRSARSTLADAIGEAQT
jgi:putative ABC transport system ATP-binding protein